MPWAETYRNKARSPSLYLNTNNINSPASDSDLRVVVNVSAIPCGIENNGIPATAIVKRLSTYTETLNRMSAGALLLN